ncbi:MAG: hypothetical protein KatS3mg108_0633 [Isosphaeraceae bacterium]|jgi:uncharacterized integral membrane protein|nr:MAG: hypothetical protein KatS3mg108_0633 [Isosphaeraceae bacterium]
MNVQLRVLALIVGLGLFLTFVLQNTESVALRFLGFKFETILSVHWIISYLLGMLTGWATLHFVARSVRRIAERRRAAKA